MTHRLCTYIVRTDSGLAPNSFRGYCTLAVCTPNHMGVRLKKDDWIVGFQSKSMGNKLLYAMKVQECLDFNVYYKDPRFAKKIPKKQGTPHEQCGDNMYYQDQHGIWHQHPTWYHQCPCEREKDLQHPTAFISKHFYYFGKNAICVPKRFLSLIPGMGVKCNHDERIVSRFLKWLQANFTPGRHGEPVDLKALHKIPVVKFHKIKASICNKSKPY